MDLFGTAGIRGDAHTSVTPSLALAVGRAVGTDAEEVVVGRDGRETGTALAAAIEAGATSAGARVLRAGQLPTPALASASCGRYGVMLTASHNPPEDNGIKLFSNGEEFDADAEARIEEQVERGTEPVQWDKWQSTEQIDLLSMYRSDVVEYTKKFSSDSDSASSSGSDLYAGSDLDRLSVVVDCGNGVASLATPQVLRELGAHVVALNANLDGHFPGRPSKPTPETLTDLCAFVADYDNPVVGIAHDGDADRIVIVDGDGEIVHEDTVLAILAEHYVRKSDADDPVVVTTPNASGRIDERIETAGGRVERVRLGYLHDGIATIRNEGGTVVFAGEPWKHIHPALGPWIDGVASAALLSVLIANVDDSDNRNALSALREPITERPYRKVSVECPDESKSQSMDRLRETLSEQFSDATVGDEYGVRLDFDDGSWTLVRPSGTEPYIRVYAESDAVDELVSTVTDSVEHAVTNTNE
jgi:phosphomannomutase